MPSAWAVIDGLMREIGAVRADARSLDAREVGAAIAAQIDRAINDAAAALDAAIETPEDDEALTGVCEAIVVARDQIEALRKEGQRSKAAVAHSIELRRRTAEILLRSIRERAARREG
jgi:hypothetical protein